MSDQITREDNAGYVTSDNGDVSGVYIDGATIIEVDGGAALASKDGNDGFRYSDLISTEDMSRLCVMWLAIFDPESLKFDDEG